VREAFGVKAVPRAPRQLSTSERLFGFQEYLTYFVVDKRLRRVHSTAVPLPEVLVAGAPSPVATYGRRCSAAVFAAVGIRKT